MFILLIRVLIEILLVFIQQLIVVIIKRFVFVYVNWGYVLYTVVLDGIPKLRALTRRSRHFTILVEVGSMFIKPTPIVIEMEL